MCNMGYFGFITALTTLSLFKVILFEESGLFAKSYYNLNST